MKKIFFSIAVIFALAVGSANSLQGADKPASDFIIKGSGQVNGGEYNKVEIHGSAKITGDIKAAELRNSGTLDAVGNINSKKVHSSGTMKIEGSLESDLVEASGSLKVSGKMLVKDLEASGSVTAGSLSGNTVNTAGGLKFDKDVSTKSFTSSGGIDIGGALNADKIAIKLGGDSKIGLIKGKNIEIKRVLELFFKNSRLITESVEGDDIYLENVNAKLVKGRVVKIGPNCEIGTIEYKESINVESNSKVEKQLKIK